MTNGLMNLIAGVLMFLAVLVPIIANIWRWGTQKGFQKLIVSVCIILLSFAFYATGIIGSRAHWNVGPVFACLIVYALVYGVGLIVGVAATQAPPNRVALATAVMIVPFVVNLCLLAFVMATIYTDRKFDTLKKAVAEQGSPTPAPKSTPDLSR
jgi:uncharacterized membrane protein (DUF485 family)